MGVEPVASLDRCISNTTEWSRLLYQCIHTSTNERETVVLLPPPHALKRTLESHGPKPASAKGEQQQTDPFFTCGGTKDHCQSRSLSSDSVLSGPNPYSDERICASGNPSYRRAKGLQVLCSLRICPRVSQATHWAPPRSLQYRWESVC